MKKITKKLREQAADMLAIWASSDVAPPTFMAPIPGLAICATLGIGNDPWSRALDAWRHTHRMIGPQFADAEAESLLRTGYVPPGWRNA